MSIKVNINYNTGRYEILGIVNGKRMYHYKPIRGVDHTFIYKKNFNKGVIIKRRKEIKNYLNNHQKGKEIYYDNNSINNIDTTLFKVVYEFDQFYGTKYSDDYLKIMTQKIEKTHNMSAKEFNDYCKNKRQKELKDAGIEIEYRLSIAREEKNDMTLLDKIKGIFIAIRQSKLTGAKVKFNFFNSDYNKSTEVKEKQMSDLEKKDAKYKKVNDFKKRIKQKPSNTVDSNQKLDDVLKEVKEIIQR